jgi:FkbM family methyltransferase
VEIGAANFDTLLPLAKMGWSGVIVEPVPYLAQQLIDMSRGYDVQVIQKAVSDFDGEIDIAIARDDGSWLAGCSHVISGNHLGYKLSTNKDRVGDFDENITVPCITLDTLLDYCGGECDLLKVDTEGHELNIFMNYSFDVKPSLIKVEHKHIDDNILRRKLETNGYMVWTEKDDLYAVN